MTNPGWGIGHILRARRQTHGLTLLELSRDSGVHIANISRIETGERRATADILIKLARPLGYSKFEILVLGRYLSKGRRTK